MAEISEPVIEDRGERLMSSKPGEGSQDRESDGRERDRGRHGPEDPRDHIRF